MTLTDTLSDQAPSNLPDESELLVEQPFVLQTPEQFRDDFARAASQATHQVGLEVMQFELNQNTQPIFDALKLAKQGALNDVRFHYDRVALSHIRTSETEEEDISSAYIVLGRAAMYGGAKNKDAVRANMDSRVQLVQDLEEQGITNPAYRKRGEHKILSHNHVKIAIADNEVWFGTMNLRGIDFSLSNFMVKVTDPYFVDAIKEVFEQTEKIEPGEDKTYPKYNDEGAIETILMLDSGIRSQSAIFEKAVEMAESLEPGDEFILINQWPPVEGKLGKVVYGDLIDVLSAQTQAGAKGTYLMSKPDDLHPIEGASRYLQRKAKEMDTRDPNVTTINLSRSTHAKALLIKRADGRREVLFGSHNLTKWTVRNGTRELAMWSQDPEIVDQIADFLSAAQSE